MTTIMIKNNLPNSLWLMFPTKVENGCIHAIMASLDLKRGFSLNDD